MVYFVQAIDGGRIKIGTTIRLSERLGQLDYQYRVSHRVLGVIDGGYAEERALHEKFSHLRETGEFFADRIELREFIEAECRPWDGSDDPGVRQFAVVKIDVDALSVSKKVAGLRGITLADYLSDLVLPIATKDLQMEARKIVGKDKPTTE